MDWGQQSTGGQPKSDDMRRGAQNFRRFPKGGGRKMLDLISFFNVPKTQLFHVLGYFGHFSFFVQVGGGEKFQMRCEGGRKILDASSRGAKNFRRSIISNSFDAK